MAAVNVAPPRPLPEAGQLLDNPSLVGGLLAPASADQARALAAIRNVLSQAADQAAQSAHRNLPRLQALLALAAKAEQLYASRNGHADADARALARAFLTPGLPTGTDPRTLWLLGRQLGVLAVAMNPATGRREVVVVGARRTEGPRATAHAPVYALPWDEQGRDLFMDSLVHLCPTWAIERLRTQRGRRLTRLSDEDRGRYHALHRSDLAREICAAEPIRGRLAW